MSTEVFDFVIPLYRIRWNTRAVLEGITFHYQPRAIHVIAPATEAQTLTNIAQKWQTAPLFTHEEESFFQTVNLTKNRICAELDLKESLYTPGWFYQQLLKLGAFIGIDGLSEWYVVWDSDLLPVNAWQLIQKEQDTVKHTFALLQHNGWGNQKIVSKWEKWMNSVLEVEVVTDEEATFIPHHMWLKQEHLKSFAKQVNQYYDSSDHWLQLMMRSANEFGTFSEYWAYVSWVANRAPDDLSYYPYSQYGKTTERFFDDGTGLFSAAVAKTVSQSKSYGDRYSYEQIDSFILSAYKPEELPSSLSFESSPRHLEKKSENMHIEESRSGWNSREEISKVDPEKPVSSIS